MKKLAMIFGLCMAMTIGLAGCGGGDSDPAQGGANTPDDVLKVSVAAQPNSGQVFAYIAKDQGYLAEEGVDVEMVYINNGTDAYQALFADQVNVMSTYGTGSPLIQIAQGQDVTIFGGYMIIGETPCFGKPETEWTSLESFRGKKIGITRFGTPDIVLKGILYDAGIYPDDVEFVEFKKNQDTLQAVANGEVDFGATATGYQLQAQALGLEIKMWPDDYWNNHSCCRMLARGEWMQDPTNQEALVRMMRAFIRAEEYLQTHQQETIDLVVQELDLDRATVESFVTSPHMKYDVDPYKSSVVKMWDKMNDFGYITDSSIDVNEHIDTALYEKALSGLLEDYPDNQFFKDKWTEFETYNR